MRYSRTFVLLPILLAGACSNSSDSTTTSGATASTTPSTSAPITVDTTSACTFLSPADFAAVGYTVALDGEDVSENFSLATTTSVACQWMNDDNNSSSSWELVIGTGGAKDAFATDLTLAQLDTVTTLALGDEAFLVDKVSSFDSNDHDFEAGVRIGDTYFTMSTTDDHGAEAITALATLVVERLTA